MNSKLSNLSSSPIAENVSNVQSIPDGYVNRKMLREQANISEHDLKSLEGQGIIKAAKIGRSNWRLYSLTQVDRVRELGQQIRARREARTNPDASPKHLPAFRDQPVPYSNDEYELVMDAVEKGIPRERIPLETKIHAAIVKNILKDQSEMAGAIFIAKPIVDTINALDLPGVGTVRTADDLLEAMKLINEEIVNGRKCLNCKEGRQRTHCKECLNAAVAEEKLKGEVKAAKLAAKVAASTTKANGSTVPVTNAVTTPAVKTAPVQPPSPQTTR